ncbi:Hypothetical protein BN2458_PEG0900 [Helicobacter typhlonius]|uniref:Uncharacterized protein n=1 Tax=Helicobacter typhlonius TaxID=76936 RepID=A0A0S4PU81_9HELI|nr:Hypothetical protein BN2458_PEG0900 [Helicobacter typhlonius]
MKFLRLKSYKTRICKILNNSFRILPCKSFFKYFYFAIRIPTPHTPICHPLKLLQR